MSMLMETIVITQAKEHLNDAVRSLSLVNLHEDGSSQSDGGLAKAFVSLRKAQLVLELYGQELAIFRHEILTSENFPNFAASFDSSRSVAEMEKFRSQFGSPREDLISIADELSDLIEGAF